MLASITPQYVEMVLRSALSGDHVRAWELFDLMEDTWPRLRKNALEIKRAVMNLNKVYSEFCEEDEPPTETATARKKLVSAAMRSMRPDPASDENGCGGLMFDLLDAALKGSVVLEIDWHMVPAGSQGDIIAPRAAWWVHPTCYAWSSDGRLGLVEPGIGNTPARGASRVQDFPPNKFLIGICKTKTGSPLGGALLRPLAWWWCAANFSADWLLNLAQIFGLPFRWANYEANASSETVAAICDMLANMGSAGWAAFPTGTLLELKAEGLKSGDATPQGNMLDRADTQCDLLILGQTLTTKMDAAGGSRAAATVHEVVKYENVMACAEYAEEVLETQLFPMILRMNFGDDTECPEISLESDDEGDLTKDAEVISTLAQAGAGEVIGLDWLGKRFQIPKPGKGERTLGDVKKDNTPKLLPRPMNPDADNDPDPELSKDAVEELKAACAISDDAEFSAAIQAIAAKL